MTISATLEQYPMRRKKVVMLPPTLEGPEAFLAKKDGSTTWNTLWTRHTLGNEVESGEE